MFTIEGRAAPGLFIVGWLATLMGLGILGVGLLSEPHGASALILVLVGLTLVAVGLVSGAGSQALERRARGVSGYAGPSPFLVFTASVPVAILLGLAFTLPFGWLGLDPSSPLGALVSLFGTAGAYIGLVRLLVVGTGALTWGDMGLRRPDAGTPRLVIAAVALAVPLVYASGLLAVLLSGFLPPPESPLPLTQDVLGRLVNLVSGALVAPVAEEIFFRGFATTAWRRGMSEGAAIVRGAFFFAFVHVITVGGATFSEGVERAAFAFVVRLPIALALGWVFVRWRSLHASIGLHAAFNGLPLLLVLFGR